MPRETDSSRPSPPELLSIAAVERATGLGKDTLRVWERRYGFPLPSRDSAGVRGYPADQVERLCSLRRAVLAGERPGRLLSLPDAELARRLAVSNTSSISRRAAAPADSGGTPGGALPLAVCIETLRRDGAEGLRRWLAAGLGRLGITTFVQDGLAPLVHEVGNAWLAGRIAVYEEHLFSEAVQTVLRVALMPLQAHVGIAAPRVLLTTLPGEEHALGLLMVEALLALEGCCCIPLGTQTPVEDLLAACQAQRADVVALSFTDALAAPLARAGLARLDTRLPERVAIWAGGSAGVLETAWPSRIRVMRRLAQLAGAVQDWRRAFGATAAARPDFPTMGRE